MANRNANKIKRTMQDFSLNAVGGSSGSGVFIVTLTEGENDWLEQDKTNEEIFEALGKGPVYYVFNREEVYHNGFIVGGDQNSFKLLTSQDGIDYVYYNNGHFYLSGGPM